MNRTARTAAIAAALALTAATTAGTAHAESYPPGSRVVTQEHPVRCALTPSVAVQMIVKTADFPNGRRSVTGVSMTSQVKRGGEWRDGGRLVFGGAYKYTEGAKVIDTRDRKPVDDVLDYWYTNGTTSRPAVRSAVTGAAVVKGVRAEALVSWKRGGRATCTARVLRG